MGLIELVLILAVVGFLVYLIVTYVPMPEPFAKVIIVFVVVVLVLFLLRALVGDIAIPRLR